MMEISERIRNIQIRIKAIENRFGNKKAVKNFNVTGKDFYEKVALIQEEVYKNNFNEDSKVINMSKYDPIIKRVSEKYSIPVSLIKSVIKQESNFNEKAVSPKGAKGLMQLMPETASMLGIKNIFNPAENIEGGVRYLRMMLNRYNGDIKKALAAYNAGPDVVDKYNGIPDYRETKNYVKNILNSLRNF